MVGGCQAPKWSLEWSTHGALFCFATLRKGRSRQAAWLLLSIIATGFRTPSDTKVTMLKSLCEMAQGFILDTSITPEH
jgi:hypothetical protein